MYVLLFLISLFPLISAFANPETQILILEDFISRDAAISLMNYYDNEKTNLNRESDNQLSFSSATNPAILKIISEISNKILKAMQQNYPLNGKNYQLDHCALYSRIPGNYCAYHSDNIYFDCPIHGRDQGMLRRYCNGNCPGSKYVSNHTAWREYTALLYLNDDFTGGEILFEDGPCNKLYRKVIPIKANMVVIAPNGRNFYHEVFQIRSGRRYSLHLWYTSDPEHFNPMFR